MRERNIKKILDNIFWYLLYALPIILICFNWFRGNTISIADAFSTLGINIIIDNPIFDVLVKTFGVDGFLPVFQNNSMIEFLSYFILLVIVHVFVDVVLYIPRFCHKILDKGENYGKF